MLIFSMIRTNVTYDTTDVTNADVTAQPTVKLKRFTGISITANLRRGSYEKEVRKPCQISVQIIVY